MCYWIFNPYYIANYVCFEKNFCFLSPFVLQWQKFRFGERKKVSILTDKKTCKKQKKSLVKHVFIDYYNLLICDYFYYYNY